MRKSDKNSAILQSLKWFKDNSTTAGDGSVQTALGTYYFLINEILARHTKGTASIPERTHRRAVNLATRRWLKYKKYRENDDMVSAFFEALKVESRQLEKKQRIFNVLMFLNVDESIRNLEPVSIMGDKLEVKTWKDLSPFRTDDLWKEISLMDRSNRIFMRAQNKTMPRLWDFVPVLLSTKSYGPEAAAAIANDRLNVLRAILNMSGLRGSMTLFSTPKQLSIFLPTPVLGVFEQNGNLVSPYRTIEKYDYDNYRRVTLKDTWLTTAKFLLPFFDHELKYPSTDYHVLGLMRLYQAAIDISSTSSAFLGMWQVLESAVTFGQEDIKQQDVVSRVSTLVGMDSLLQQGLKLFAEMRNELVHNGEFVEDGDELLQTLKLIADVCVSRLLGLAKEFSTVYELRDYLEYLTLGDDVLTRKTNVITSIQKSRAATSGTS